jgi:hypothetical protein
MNRPDFWKDELHREVLRLRQAIDSDGLEGLALRSVTVERFAFVTAYIMRKLWEAEALTLDVTEFKWPVSKFPCVKAPPHRSWFAVSNDGKTWRQPLEDHYDLARPNRERLRFSKICNYLVHHLAFEVRYDSAAADLEILFNSDDSQDHLYLITLPTYVAVVEEVAYDEVRWVSRDINRSKDPVIQRRQRPADG